MDVRCYDGCVRVRQTPVTVCTILYTGERPLCLPEFCCACNGLQRRGPRRTVCVSNGKLKYRITVMHTLRGRRGPPVFRVIIGPGRDTNVQLLSVVGNEIL